MKKKNQSKFSWEKVPLSELQCSILAILNAEDIPYNQKSLVKATKATVGGVSKALDGLERLGLVVSFKQDVRAYLLNPQRKSEIQLFLTGYDLGKNKPIVLSGHAFVYESVINDLPPKLAKRLETDNSFIGYKPNGWKYAYKKAIPDGYFILQKSNSGAKLIAYFRTFGFDAKIIEQINHEKFMELKRDLEQTYDGLKIGSFERIAVCPWQEYAIQKDAVASVGIRLGIKHKKIEQSYGYPEWEEKGFNASDKIKRIIDMREREIKEFGTPLKNKSEDEQDKSEQEIKKKGEESA